MCSCDKDQNANVSFSTSSVSLGYQAAEITFTIDLEAGDNATEAGIILSEEKSIEFPTQEEYNSGNYVYDNYLWQNSTEAGPTFTIAFSNLVEYTKYYFKPYCVVNGMIQYGAEDSMTTLVPPGITIGPAGGYVIYDNGAGGGIEMALEDVSIVDQNGYEDLTFEWGCSGLLVSGTSTNVGSGEANSALILQSCTQTNTAASLCDAFELNGFTDWYLPSVSELNLIRNNIAVNGYGNFTSYSDYWSSSESDGNYANFIEMSGTGTGWYSTLKSSNKRVRAVRTF